ncbi:MAG: hypothetical protein HC896_14130 [Bacteroidales bacterium]|nr:hypothetical protein [Bacteroidales bacterium]
MSVTVLVVTFPLYEQMLLDQFSARDNVFGEEYNVDEELRWVETQAMVRERWLDDVPWLRTLFGQEIFNSYGRYANGDLGLRPLHVDFNNCYGAPGLLARSFTYAFMQT